MSEPDYPCILTLKFEDADTLRQALDYIGESDAPVMILDGSVEADGRKFTLWEDFGAAIDLLTQVVE